VIGTTTVDANGDWSVTAATLPEGHVDVTVTQSAGIGAPTTATIGFDVVLPPAIPVVNPWIAVAAAGAVAVVLVLVLALVWRTRRTRRLAA
jgi:hypothetical protein